MTARGVYSLGAGCGARRASGDLAEQEGGNDTEATAYPLGDIERVSAVTGLSIHQEGDEDYFTFALASDGVAGDSLAVGPLEIDDGQQLQVELRLNEAPFTPIAPTGEDGVSTFDLAGAAAGEYLLRVVGSGGTARYEIAADVGAEIVSELRLSGSDSAEVSLSGLPADAEYLLQVTSPNVVPTTYSLTFDFGAGDTPVERNLGVAGQAEARRDVILGGTGHDVLAGGAGEDWIFGGAGHDVLAGGLDRQAPDLLFGGDDDDTYQIIPDALPLLNDSDETFVPTFADAFIEQAGEGDDRVLLLGTAAEPSGLDLSALMLEDPVQGQGYRQADVDAAFSVEGGAAHEGLATTQVIGDLNGDGFDDVLFSGAGPHYVMFGPFDARGAEQITDVANLVISQDLGRPATRQGDINGDGLGDLVFADAGDDAVNILYGALTPSFNRQVTEPSLSVQLEHDVADDTTLAVLDWDGDRSSRGHPYADLAVVFGSLLPGDEAAYVLSGQALAAEADDDLAVDAADYLIIFTADATDEPAGGETDGRILVLDELFPGWDTTWGMTLADAVPSFGGGVAGDVNGDGLDDLVVVDTAFAELNGALPVPNLGRAYLLLGGGASAGLPLDQADGLFDAFSLSANVIELGDIGTPTDTPDLGRLDLDGRDDFALARDLEDFGQLDTGPFNQGPSLAIFMGEATEELDLLHDIAIRRLGDVYPHDVYFAGSLTATAGDFNDDGQMDLVVAESQRLLTSNPDPDRSPAEILDLQEQGSIHVFWSAAQHAQTSPDDFLLLHEADIVAEGPALGDHLGTLPSTPGSDVNADGIDDLLLGAPGADGFTGQVVDEAGKVYVILGSPWRLPTDERPDDADVVVLSNRSLFDSSDGYLVDTASGPAAFVAHDLLMPERLDATLSNGDATATGTLAAHLEAGIAPGTVALTAEVDGADAAFTDDGAGSLTSAEATVLTGSINYGTGAFSVELGGGESFTDDRMSAEYAWAGWPGRWFRFTTLGDGRPGDQIRILPASASVTDATIEAVAATLTDDEGSWTVEPGEPTIDDGKVVVLEFDLSGVAGRFLQQLDAGNADYLDSVTLNVSLTGGTLGDLDFAVLGDEADLAVTPADGDAPAAELPALGDLTDVVADSLAAGKYRLALRLSLAEAASGPITIDGAATMRVRSQQSPRIVADVYDADFGRLLAGRALIGMRTMPAGTYLLRVYADPAGPAPADEPPVVIEIDPPFMGMTNPATPPDRDQARGGDGDDIVIGGGQLDRLYGDSGDDRFVGSRVEIRDLGDGTASPDEIAARLDPLSPDVVREANLPVPLDPDVPFADANLAAAVAEALGLPVTAGWDGEPIVHGDIRASALAALTELDAGGLGILYLDGIQHAANLEILNIAGKLIGDLSPLAPGLEADYRPLVGAPIGMGELEYLFLDDNPITDLTNLAGLTELRGLSVDRLGDGEDVVADVGAIAGLANLKRLSVENHQVADVGPLADLAHLEYLHLRDNRIGEIGPLVGEYLVDDGLAIGFDDDFAVAGSGWHSNVDPVDTAYGEDYRFHDYRNPDGAPVAAPEDGGYAACTWTFAGLPAGTYEVMATWPWQAERYDQYAYRASAAAYRILDGSAPVDDPALPEADRQDQPAPVNQRFRPGGTGAAEFLGSTWQSVGEYAIASGTLTVELSNLASAGWVLADAVRVLRSDVAPALPALTALDVRGNALDNESHEAYIPTLADRVADGEDPMTDLLYDANAEAPTWLAEVEDQSAAAGEEIQIALPPVTEPGRGNLMVVDGTNGSVREFAGPGEENPGSSEGYFIDPGAVSSDPASFSAFVVTQLTDNDYDDTSAHISGSNIIWQGAEGGDDPEVFFYDGQSTTQVTDNDFADTGSNIDGTAIAWVGQDRLYTYDHAVGGDPAPTPGSTCDPAIGVAGVQISGSNIV